MKYPNLNLFIAWFLIAETLAMRWVAMVGRTVLELFGVETLEGDIPGRLMGAVLLLGVLSVVLVLRRTFPPEGKPDGNGYRLGHHLVLAASVLAALLFIFPFTSQLLPNPDVVMVVFKFTNAFGYWVMAIWAIGFSLIYQSGLPVKPSNN